MSIEEQGQLPESEQIPVPPTTEDDRPSSDMEVVEVPPPTPTSEQSEEPAPNAPSASSTDVVPTDAASEDDGIDYVAIKNTPNPNVNLTDKVLKPFDTSKREFPFDRLAVLMANHPEFQHRLLQWNNAKWGSDEKTRAWAFAMTEAIDHLATQDPILKVLEKSMAEFMQTIDAGGTKLGSALAKITDHSTGEERLSGDAAAIRMQQALGQGALVQVPLWHTGIWVTLKAPSERDLLLLERSLVMEKTTLGKDTSGRVFSAQGTYAIAHVINFVLKHVYSATVQDTTKLKDIILLNDLHALVLGLMMATYPSGYPLSRVCVADPSNCKHVTEEVVSLPKLLFVSKRALSEKQLAHMRKRSTQFTEADLKAYQAEHQYAKMPTVQINERVTVELRIPTLAVYEDSGRRWIDEVIALTDSSIGADVSEQERDAKVTEMALSQAVRQYGHWVGQIVIDGKSIIDDTKAIEETIASISGNEVYEEAFYEGVSKWITETTIALVAIPNYDCPSCGKKQVPNPELAIHPHLIALDTIQTFFTLLARRLARIKSRLMA